MRSKRQHKVKYEDFNEVGFETNQALFKDRTQASDDTLVVLVTHAFYSAIPYIEACEEIGGKKNLHLVMKTSSNNQQFKADMIKSGYGISDLVKSDFKTHPELFIKEIKHALKDKHLKKVLIMDHGGYASYHLQELSNELPLSGIVEYTINGQNKYDEVFRLHPELKEKVHYISIGKSRLKHYADVSCGQLIGELVQQATQELTGFGIHLRDFTRVGIVGFGKLGKAAANQLKLNGAQNMMVYDVDEDRRTEAHQAGYRVVANSKAGLHELLEKCSVVIVGTDKKPIDKDDFTHLRPKAIITGVTSADDTWDLPERIKDGSAKPHKKLLMGKFTTLICKNGGPEPKLIYALTGGEAPNLAGSEIGVNDPSINLPTSLHTLVAWDIAKYGKVPDAQKVQAYEAEIQQKYNNAFAHVQSKLHTGYSRGL